MLNLKTLTKVFGVFKSNFFRYVFCLLTITVRDKKSLDLFPNIEQYRQKNTLLLLKQVLIMCKFPWKYTLIFNNNCYGISLAVFLYKPIARLIDRNSLTKLFYLLKLSS